MREVFLIDEAHTPRKREGSTLAAERPDDLAALAAAEAIRRTGVDPAARDDAILGAADQAGEDNRTIARTAMLGRGLASLCAGVGQGISMLMAAA
ncbi:hypothetical protein [Nocardia sp. NPDC049707]|uniref:thiolase family protein n=1 Tax=Nocardia sp. NPDC049707 TaxID=3154735 RepID=UPI00342F567C